MRWKTPAKISAFSLVCRPGGGGGGGGCAGQLLAMFAEGVTPSNISSPTWCRFDSVEVGYPRTLSIVGGGIVAGQPDTQRY